MRDPIETVDRNLQTISLHDELDPMIQQSFIHTNGYPTTPATTSGRQLAQQQQATYATTPRGHSRSTFERPVSGDYFPQVSRRHGSAHRDPESKHQTSLVYILNCAHCDAFFTDRGMKVCSLLLLLLFSNRYSY